MLDKRIALESGYQLSLNTEAEYRIVQEIGRGAGCIVYDAGYKDNLGLDHRVRVKECYPYTLELELKRETDGSLVIIEKEQDQFEKNQKKFKEEQEKFTSAYKRNTALGNTLGLINSTVNVSNIYHKNNTIYTVMNYDEGVDFSHYTDKDLRSVFIRIRAVAEIVKKYHSQGFLHLDIKPENIMIIPETREHVILFDFDSMIVEKEKTAGDLQLSFSDGFSAPEQVRGEIEKISKATDIYSLGALLFYKIFGRVAESSRNCSLGAKFDFSKMLYPDKRYQQAMFRKLEEFLHKTLSISIICRWKDMDEVLYSLDALIRLADFEHLFLYSNFQYNVNCFTGRRKELKEIKEYLQEHQILFLHGIGGIGKTELAKRFLFENRDDFNHVIFVSFQGSIVETITGTDITIGNFEEEENEHRGHYFNRKIEALKSVVSEDDIILLDNFDVSEDNELETLLECPCKFLITTREDFRDYNYPQITIREMEKTEDLLQLFCAYNSREYEDSEKLCIKEMIRLLDKHTMMVELLAKYLRDSMETVFELKEKLWENTGITGMTDVYVKHRKDKRRHSGNVSEHLLMLFQLSDFSKKEYELIKSLSLLGYLKINKKVFLNYCDSKENAKELQRLICRGFIEYEENTDKISLHQIILDLVYNHLKPTSESCPAITKGMARYACEKMENSVDKNIRKKMLGLFLNRISGADDNLAEFYLSYCMQIRNEEFLLDKVEKICTLSNSRKHYDFLRLVCMQRIKLLVNIQTWIMEDGKSDDYFHQLAIQMTALVDKSEEYMEKLSLNNNDKLYFYAELGTLISKEAENVELQVFGEDGGCLDIIYTKAQELLEKAAELIENSETDITSEEKIDIYKKLLAFYQDMDFSAAYRSEHYGDKEKLLYFSAKIEEERRKGEEETNNNFNNSEVSYETCGDNAVFQEEHEKAIIYYKKAIEASESEIEMSWILSKLAKEYKIIKEYEKAAECLLKELTIDKEIGIDISYTCNDLADLFIEQGDFVKAEIYCDKAIQYQEEKGNNKRENKREENIEGKKEKEEREKGDDKESYNKNKIWLIALYMKKYRMTEGKEKKFYYKKCKEYYQDYNKDCDKDEIDGDSRICSFLELMYKRELEIEVGMTKEEEKEKNKEEKIIITAKKILKLVKQYNEKWEYECAKKMISLLLSEDGRKRLEQGLDKNKSMEIIIEALCYCCDIFKEEKDVQKALACCLEAEEKMRSLSINVSMDMSNSNSIINNQNVNNQNEKKWEYLSSFLFAKQGEVYYRLGDYEKGEIAKKQCNYYLLAEVNEKEKGLKLEKKLEYWEDAAEAYLNIDKYAKAEQCFRRWFALFEQVFGQYSYSSFKNYWNMSFKRIQGLLRQNLMEDVYRWNTELYLKTVDKYQEKIILLLQQGEKKEKEEREQNKIKQDFCWRLEQIAENYNMALYYKQAVIIYFIALIETVGERKEEIDLKQIVYADKEKETDIDIQKNIIKVLIIKVLRKKNVSKSKVDLIVNIFEKVKKINEKMERNSDKYNKWFDKVIEQYKKFTKMYQYGEVEFKR